MHGDRKLRSAQAAFELLDSFAGSGVTARGAVAGAMLNKEADILAQFAHEVRWPASTCVRFDLQNAFPYFVAGLCNLSPPSNLCTALSNAQHMRSRDLARTSHA